MFYKNLGQEELWLDCAEKLTAMIQNIIEFAKLIPGFMRLSQDDQVSKLILTKSIYEGIPNHDIKYQTNEIVYQVTHIPML